MKTLLKTSLIALTATLAACAQTPRQAAVPSTLLVPSAMIVQHTDLSTGQLALSPYSILPASDADTLFVGRADKFAYGQTTYTQFTSYSIFTYDQQLISNISGPSYRYSLIDQVGVTSP
jgi:type IV pilus biogenesis protein CpaD/CtpE